MLKHWMTHAEYQQFISDAVSHLNESQLKKLSSYKDSLDKLTSLNLDPVGEFLVPFIPIPAGLLLTSLRLSALLSL